MDVDSPMAALVRRHDPDRYYCTLFAPEPARAALFTLYAFNHELARAREVATEPGLALIRLHWWREVVEGAARRHEVATPLSALLQAGLDPAPLLLMIETREAQVEGPPATLDDFSAQMLAGPGALARAAGAALGADDAALARLAALGAAYGIAGTLRSIPAWASRQACLLPLDVLAAAGLSEHAAIADPGAAWCAVQPRLAALARSMLGQPAPLRTGLAAGLPAVLARRDLQRDPCQMPPGPRGAADRLAVLWAAIRGRV